MFIAAIARLCRVSIRRLVGLVLAAAVHARAARPSTEGSINP